jgi:hypothetical protein
MGEVETDGPLGTPEAVGDWSCATAGMATAELAAARTITKPHRLSDLRRITFMAASPHAWNT